MIVKVSNREARRETRQEKRNRRSHDYHARLSLASVLNTTAARGEPLTPAQESFRFVMNACLERRKLG
jgi:hypothetical protein